MKARFFLFLFLYAGISMAAWALPEATNTPRSAQARPGATHYAESVDDETLARPWGLKTEEWSRYQQLMRGPLGIYSPGLDPLTALGIEARSDEERRRYAELQVKAEAHRVEKELAYQLAYDEAWKRLYPNLLPVTGLSAPEKTQPTATAQGRLAVFVTQDCPACERRVKQLQRDGRAFDLFLIGSKNDDIAIRRWAARVGIAPDKVRARSITLNHDNGRWQRLVVTYPGVAGDFPAVLKEVEGQWRRER